MLDKKPEAFTQGSVARLFIAIDKDNNKNAKAKFLKSLLVNVIFVSFSKI